MAALQFVDYQLNIEELHIIFLTFKCDPKWSAYFTKLLLIRYLLNLGDPGDPYLNVDHLFNHKTAQQRLTI